VFEEVYPKIKAGIKEKDVVDMMLSSLKKHGASDFSFGTIVASGNRSSMPHGVASDKLIESNDIITVDWGVILDHYCSDCTRTFFMQEPTNKKLMDMYQTVLKANKAAIAAVKAGVSTKVVDRVARDVVAAAGYGEYFNHGTGHALGIDIHEYPRLNPFTDVLLETNMVITIEPGIYIEGVGGVRIEDVVVVKENGCEVLTKLNKELQYKTEGKEQ
jgi:Xaa-Pro aminopeptidase